AGGVAPQGETRSVLAVDVRHGRVRTAARLPEALAHAPLVALHGALYLVGGRTATGGVSRNVLRIDPRGGVRLAARLPVGLADAAAVASGGRILVVGGAGAAPSRTVYAVSPRP